jgi:hypothetical protein
MVEGLATRLEGLDDDHTPTAARAGTRQLGLIIGACFFLGLLEDGGTAQELAEASDVGGPVAIGKQSIVADTVKTLREDVHEEAANELVRVERHRLPAIGSIERLQPSACRIHCNAAIGSPLACVA